MVLDFIAVSSHKHGQFDSTDGLSDPFLSSTKMGSFSGHQKWGFWRYPYINH